MEVQKKTTSQQKNRARAETLQTHHLSREIRTTAKHRAEAFQRWGPGRHDATSINHLPFAGTAVIEDGSPARDQCPQAKSYSELHVLGRSLRNRARGSGIQRG